MARPLLQRPIYVMRLDINIETKYNNHIQASEKQKQDLCTETASPRKIRYLHTSTLFSYWTIVCQVHPDFCEMVEASPSYSASVINTR